MFRFPRRTWPLDSRPCLFVPVRPLSIPGVLLNWQLEYPIVWALTQQLILLWNLLLSLRGGGGASHKLRRPKLLSKIREFFRPFTMFTLRINLNITFNTFDRSEIWKQFKRALIQMRIIFYQIQLWHFPDVRSPLIWWNMWVWLVSFIQYIH